MNSHRARSQKSDTRKKTLVFYPRCTCAASFRLHLFLSSEVNGRRGEEGGGREGERARIAAAVRFRLRNPGTTRNSSLFSLFFVAGRKKGEGAKGRGAAPGKSAIDPPRVRCLPPPPPPPAPAGPSSRSLFTIFPVPRKARFLPEPVFRLRSFVALSHRSRAPDSGAARPNQFRRQTIVDRGPSRPSSDDERTSCSSACGLTAARLERDAFARVVIAPPRVGGLAGVKARLKRR